MHQRIPFRIKGLAGPTLIRRRPGRLLVKGQVPLELDLVVSGVRGAVMVVIVIIDHLQPRVDSLQHLGALLVYLVPHNVGRLQADLGPLGGQGPRVRRLAVLQQPLVLVQDANLLGFHGAAVAVVAGARKLAAPRPRQAVAARLRCRRRRYARIVRGCRRRALC